MKNKIKESSNKLVGLSNMFKQLPSVSLIVSYLFTVFMFSCTEHEESLDDRISQLQLKSLPAIVHPANNPSTPAKVLLGKALFWDPILSGENNIACGTCHDPTMGYGDNIKISIGPGGTGRGLNRQPEPGRAKAPTNSQPAFNLAYNGMTNANMLTYDPLVHGVTNWRPMARSLEAQVFGPINSIPHMKGSGQYDASTVGDIMVNRLKAIAEYVQRFDQVFNGTAGSGVTKDNIAQAIATFERSEVSNHSPFDRYVNGELDALTKQQKAGLLLFFGKANCSTCHSDAMQTDWQPYNLGIPYNPDVTPVDQGANNEHKWRTPSLRNVELTAPYMHNGMVATLDDVLEFYNNGVSLNPNAPAISSKIVPLNLSEKEISNLKAFLLALSDPSWDMTVPTSVPSGLPPGGN